MTADTQVLEQEIDAMVYELYGLSAEEIAIVEGTAKWRPTHHEHSSASIFTKVTENA